jgi:hypothetical protein
MCSQTRKTHDGSSKKVSKKEKRKKKGCVVGLTRGEAIS